MVITNNTQYIVVFFHLLSPLMCWFRLIDRRETILILALLYNAVEFIIYSNKRTISGKPPSLRNAVIQ